MLQRKPGGPYSWAVRRASLSLPVRNATENPCPRLVGQGFAAPSRQRWQAALPPYLPTQKLAKMAEMTSSEASRPVTLSNRLQTFSNSGLITSGLNPS